MDFYNLLLQIGGRGGAVCWRTALQAGSSWVWIPDGATGIFH